MGSVTRRALGCAAVALAVMVSRADAGSLTLNPTSVSITTPINVNKTGATIATATGAVTIGSVTFGAGCGADITDATAGEPIVMANGDTATVTVKFAPTVAETESCTATIRDAVGTAITTFPLTATATNAVIAVTDPLDFTIVVDNTTVSKNIAISNSASGTQSNLNVTSAVIDTASSTWFTFGAGNGCAAGSTTCTFSGTGLNIPPSVNVPVQCTPPATATGTQTTTVTFTSNSDPGGTNVSHLSCTAGRPVIVVSTTMISFGNQLINTTSSPTTFTIKNDSAAGGNEPLTYTLSIGGTNAGLFAFSSGCTTGCTVMPGNTNTIGVTFTPIVEQANLTATITVTNNDPAAQGVNTPTIALSGNGIAPDITDGTTTLNYNNIDVGSSSGTQSVTVMNSGTATLTITSADFAAPQNNFFVATGTQGAQTTNVLPGNSTTWTLFCSPSAFGLHSATFKIASNAHTVNGALGSTLAIALNCTGLQGVINVSTTTITFGGVRDGDTAMQTVTVSNPGNVAVTGITAALGSNMLGYTLSGVPAMLAAGGSAIVTVTFAPNGMGAEGGATTLVFSGSWTGNATHAVTSSTINITGSGLTIGLDTNPKPTLDFGSIRFDQPVTMPLQIINTGAANVSITNLMITPGVGTMSGELTLGVPAFTHNGTTVTLPVPLTGNNCTPSCDTLVANLKCVPNNRVAALTAQVTVTTDLMMNNTRTVNLTCNSTGATLVMTPPTNVLDFGGVDVQANPHSVTQTITMMNTGTGTLNVGQGVVGGANKAQFAFSSISPTTVTPGGTFTVDVTYTPGMEKPSNAGDLALITFPLTGICAPNMSCPAPSSAMITLKGFGIDRHISIGPAPTFPDTFRNPGSSAPVLPVTITNTGAAQLSISGVMISGEPVWTLVDPTPVDIPGGGTYAFKVRFAPTAAGKAPDGELVLMDNDSSVLRMVSIGLTGRGLDRSVQMSPVVVDLGYTGVGIPAKLSDVAPNDPLLVTSMDATNTFKIRAIAIDGGDGQFTLASPPSNLTLAPKATQTFDVVFLPTAEGEVDATATLFLDQDPQGQSFVQLRGRGVVVDAGGGGGCSTSGGAGGGALVAIAALLAARRRRGAACAIVVIFVGVGTAHAQATRDLSVTVFDPTPSTTGNQLQVQSANVGANGEWIATVLATYTNDPVVFNSPQNDDAAVKNRMMLVLGGAYAFLGRFEAGAHMPFYVQNGQTVDPLMEFGVPPASGAARGDLTLHAKARLARAGGVAIGLGGALTLPTSTGGEFAGADQPTGRVLALASLVPAALERRLAFDVNAGALIRARAEYANIEQRSAFAFGAAAAFHAGDRTWLAAELFGDVTPDGRYAVLAGMGPGKTATTMVAVVGARYQAARTWTIGGALGRGLIAGLGAPALQASLSLAYTPRSKLSPLVHHPRIDGDRDGDGIPDSIDKCPDEPEDKDGFQDADGCPDPDNDQDGILDKDDQCPNEPEDRDGYQDHDGCPDPDNDGDGIPDKKDRCPNAAEDFDGFQDADGCPDPDNDKDGIPDAADHCPNEPETINGIQDDDGCPDKGDSSVVLSPDRLELLDTVRFTRDNHISKQSFSLVGQIAATLRAHPEIVRVRITSHVQPSSNSDRDLAVTEKRAQAVHDWLVQWGIAAGRLEARGFGGSKPLAPATQAGAAQINDRLEFVILERK